MLPKLEGLRIVRSDKEVTLGDPDIGEGLKTFSGEPPSDTSSTMGGCHRKMMQVSPSAIMSTNPCTHQPIAFLCNKTQPGIPLQESFQIRHGIDGPHA